MGHHTKASRYRQYPKHARVVYDGYVSDGVEERVKPAWIALMVSRGMDKGEAEQAWYSLTDESQHEAGYVLGILF